MGGCLKSQHDVEGTNSIRVSKNLTNEEGFDVIQINTSYLYFLLRKEAYARLKDRTAIQTEFLDLTDQRDKCIMTAAVSASQLTSAVKVLYDFRTLVIFDEVKNNQLSANCKDFLKKLKQFKVVPTKIMIYSQSVRQLLKNFEFFTEKQIQKSLLSRMNIPILLFDSREISQPKGQLIRIYIHSNKMAERNELLEPTFYKNTFKIIQEFKQFCKGNTDDPSKIAEYRKIIKDCISSGRNLLVLHSQASQQNEIAMQTLKVVCEIYGLNPSLAAQYFSQKFPLMISKANEEQRQQVIYSTKILKKEEPATKSEQLATLLAKYNRSVGNPAFTEKSYNLLCLLLDNICKSPQTESYRMVKTTNAQLGQHFFKHQAGRQLLQSVGFYQREGNIYKNDMEVKYLKTYRTDLELAYRKLQDQK